jgi:lactosylceramide 4-alpha-galactosyltransferase
VQVCSIESAAKHHPESRVVVFVDSDKLLVTPAVSALLSEYPNVELLKLDVDSLTEDNPLLSSWLREGELNRSLYRTSHTSDVLRYATLFKHGGLYLDLDVIVLRPVLGFVRNTLGLESILANGAIMAFDRRHPFIADCIRDVVHRCVNLL